MLPLGLGLSVFGLTAGVLGGCVAGSSLDSGDGGVEGGSDAASGDGATTGDGGLADSGFTCGQLGGTYDSVKACATVADCTTVARGCHCGAQPVIGIAKSSASAAQACEAQAASQCALGCANLPGQVAEDGASDVDGGTITVKCDLGKCHTVVQ